MQVKLKQLRNKNENTQLRGEGQLASRLFYYIHMAYYNKLASAIYNDVVSGLRGYSSNPTMSLEQLEDDCIDERLQIIKEYFIKGLVPKKDLLLSINCIDIDCKSLERCACSTDGCDTLVAHFEIPQLLTEFGDAGVEYIGSTDRMNPFIYYVNPIVMKYHKYGKRTRKRPYVYIDVSPNENNMYDCFVFNAPLLKQVSVVGIFKDPRQLEEYGCCSPIDINNMTFIDAEIKKRLTEKKLRYYRQLAVPVTPNDQQPQ